MKLKALKFMLLGKEFKCEISYSEKYLQKIKTLSKYLHPERKN